MSSRIGSTPQGPSPNRSFDTFVSLFDTAYEALARGVLLVAVFLLFPSRRGAPRRLLVMRNCFFGDFIVCIPALRLLRSKGGLEAIDLLSAATTHRAWRKTRRDSEIFGIEPGLLDEVIEYPGDAAHKIGTIRRLRDDLKSRRHDSLILFPYSGEPLSSRLKKLLYCRLAGFKGAVYGYESGSIRAIKRWDRHRLRREDIPHQTTSALHAVATLLGTTAAPCIDRAHARVVARSPGRPPRVAIAPFSKQPVKAWGSANFAAVADELASACPDLVFEVYGSESERRSAAELIAFCHRAVVRNECGIPLAELTERISACELMICVDSGLMHLASLHDLPVVCVFPQIALPQLWRPWSSVSNVITHQVDCAPCGATDGHCPKAHGACVSAVRVEEVVEASIGLLTMKSSKRRPVACANA